MRVRHSVRGNLCTSIGALVTQPRWQVQQSTGHLDCMGRGGGGLDYPGIWSNEGKLVI
jgi:hypothetical protein